MPFEFHCVFCIFRYLLQKKYYQNIIDLTEVLNLLEVLFLLKLNVSDRVLSALLQSSSSKLPRSKRISESPHSSLIFFLQTQSLKVYIADS